MDCPSFEVNDGRRVDIHHADLILGHPKRQLITQPGITPILMSWLALRIIDSSSRQLTTERIASKRQVQVSESTCPKFFLQRQGADKREVRLLLLVRNGRSVLPSNKFCGRIPCEKSIDIDAETSNRLKFGISECFGNLDLDETRWAV